LTTVSRQQLTKTLPTKTSQPFAAPIFSLLFHRWLLSKEKSLKHLGIMIAGCRQLFLGDVDAGTTAFGPLHAYVFFLTDSIHHHPSPSITIHHHPSPSITIHHHPSPSIGG
jgi:hypothetical protein